MNNEREFSLLCNFSRHPAVFIRYVLGEDDPTVDKAMTKAREIQTVLIMQDLLHKEKNEKVSEREKIAKDTVKAIKSGMMTADALRKKLEDQFKGTLLPKHETFAREGHYSNHPGVPQIDDLFLLCVPEDVKDASNLVQSGLAIRFKAQGKSRNPRDVFASEPEKDSLFGNALNTLKETKGGLFPKKVQDISNRALEEGLSLFEARNPMKGAELRAQVFPAMAVAAFPTTYRISADCKDEPGF